MIYFIYVFLFLIYLFIYFSSVGVVHYDPLRASSYIQLPKSIIGKKACLNIQNNDSKCFLWSILASLHQVEHGRHPTRASKYWPYENEIDMVNVEFPVALKDIGKIENANSLSINVFGLEGKTVYPLRVTDQTEARHHVNLLYVMEKENGHYVLIKNLSRLVSRQVNAHNGSKHICVYCLHACQSQLILDNHVERCKLHGAQRVSMPQKNDEKGRDKIKFTKIEYQLRLPFIIYADFESILKKHDVCENNPNKSWTTKYQSHEACGYGVYTVCTDKRFYRQPHIYHGEDAAENFLDRIMHDATEIRQILKIKTAMKKLTSDQKREYGECTKCHICMKEIRAADKKVRDHCHLTGEFRGAAHNSCNLLYRIKPDNVKIPCVMHNLKGYDAHLILSAVKPRHGKVECIPNTMEKYTSFTIGGVTFIDSCQFMLSSLDQLVNNLSEFPETKKYIESIYAPDAPQVETDVSRGNDSIYSASSENSEQSTDNPHDCARSDNEGDEDDEETIDNLLNDYRQNPYQNPVLDQTQNSDVQDLLELMTRKGVYPYEYMDSFEKFKETQLPPIEAFFSTLTGNDISNSDYEHAQNVFDSLEMTDLRDFHNMYLSTDVLLLADVFESFRDTCMKHYQLDPAHNYTAPGLSWQAALKMTNVKLELLTDIDQHLFIEAGIRGGVAVISHRFAKANLPTLPEQYDAEQPNQHLVYLDANNLYGYAMSQSLPTGDFKWLSEQSIDALNLNDVASDDCRGYIYECDIEYPVELHDAHCDYPLAPERYVVTPDMLSDHQLDILERHERSNLNKQGIEFIGPIKPSTTESLPKLVPNLYNKQKYIVHYRNLQLYTSLGLKITKVHRVLSFKQSPWLKSYIDFNTQQRAAARNNFEKDFFKLMNNSMFGKTMENLRNRRNVDLVVSSKKMKKLAAQPRFKSFKIFHEHLAAVERSVTELVLNRPIYVGFCVLDLSKVLMYEFHYNYVKQRYPNDKSKLLFTDTDSLVYRIQTDNLYSDMLIDKHLFDFSGYPEDHICYSNENKKVIGKFKDELNGIPMEEFVGLKAKMYSVLYGEQEMKKAKGVKKGVIKKCIKHSDYRNCLFSCGRMSHSMNMIRSEKHKLFTVKQNKSTLSAYDDKRYILEDGITTLPYGHYSIVAT